MHSDRVEHRSTGDAPHTSQTSGGGSLIRWNTSEDVPVRAAVVVGRHAARTIVARGFDSWHSCLDSANPIARSPVVRSSGMDDDVSQRSFRLGVGAAAAGVPAFLLAQLHARPPRGRDARPLHRAQTARRALRHWSRRAGRRASSLPDHARRCRRLAHAHRPSARLGRVRGRKRPSGGAAPRPASPTAGLRSSRP
jgi:hypothetical protein